MSGRFGVRRPSGALAGAERRGGKNGGTQKNTEPRRGSASLRKAPEGWRNPKGTRGPTRSKKAAPTWERDFLRTLRAGIERETLLMPWLVADSVVAEVERIADADLGREWRNWLDARAERVFARNAHFRRLITNGARRGNAGRDALWRFFRHWLSSRLKRERPPVFRRLPREYAMGVLREG